MLEHGPSKRQNRTIPGWKGFVRVRICSSRKIIREHPLAEVPQCEWKAVLDYVKHHRHPRRLVLQRHAEGHCPFPAAEFKHVTTSNAAKRPVPIYENLRNV